MDRIKQRLATAVLIGAASACIPTVASAQQPQQAQQHDSAGIKQSEQLAQQAYDANAKGDYQGALTLYQQAYKATPASVILFNIANLYDKRLKDREAAVDYYKRYINSSDTEADLLKRASDRINALKAEKDAQAAAAASSSSSSSPSASNSNSNTKPAAQTPTPTPPDKDKGSSGGGDGGSTLRIVGISAGVVGLVGLGIGAGFGLSASSKADKANELCTGSECRSPEGVTLTDDARSAATISTIGFVAGGALLVGGVALFFLAPQLSSSTASAASTTLKKKRSDPSPWRVAPIAMPGGGGFFLGKAW